MTKKINKAVSRFACILLNYLEDVQIIKNTLGRRGGNALWYTYSCVVLKYMRAMKSGVFYFVKLVLTSALWVKRMYKQNTPYERLGLKTHLNNSPTVFSDV